MKKSPEVKLSIIILSFNTKDILDNCLNSLREVRGEVPFEVIVVDNASHDESPKMVKAKYPWVVLIENDKNVGFSAGNNLAKKKANGEYILFLNSDTQVYKDTLKKTVNYLDKHPEVGSVGCKIVLKNGQLDKDSRRSFPTPWVALTHFSGLDKLFPKSKIFSKYWYGYLSADETSEVDVLQGAYHLSRRKLLNEVGWFDEDYFLDGEDVDLCWKIKETGAKIIYYPEVSILHLKKASKKGNVSLKQKIKFRMNGVDAMEIFYRKHLFARYPILFNLIVILGIKMLRVLRFFEALVS